jgi:hypothetical protein
VAKTTLLVLYRASTISTVLLCIFAATWKQQIKKVLVTTWTYDDFQRLSPDDNHSNSAAKEQLRFWGGSNPELNWISKNEDPASGESQQTPKYFLTHQLDSLHSHQRLHKAQVKESLQQTIEKDIP